MHELNSSDGVMAAGGDGGGAASAAFLSESASQSTELRKAGNDAFSRGDTASAISLYSAWIELEPESEVAYSNISHARVNMATSLGARG